MNEIISQVDRLTVHECSQVADAAAAAVASKIRELIELRGRAIAIFSAAPSLHEFFNILAESPGIEWTRVIGFQSGEYLGVDEDDRRSSRKFLYDNLIKKVPMAEFHPIRGEACNPEAVCANYAALLKSRPPDFAVIDIGENGSLGFIETPFCDFNDPVAVKLAELTDSRRFAISLTVATIMDCDSVFIFNSGVDGKGIEKALNDPVSERCPSSILRTHYDAHLFMHEKSARI